MRSARPTPELDTQIRTEVAELAKRYTLREDLSRETAVLLFFRYGIYPSSQLVHSYTRLGSMTDINKDLAKFWDNIREKSRVRIEGVDLPDDVLNQVGDVINQLWQLSQAKAHESLDGLRLESQQKVETAEQEARYADELKRITEERLVEAEENLKLAEAAREEAGRLLAIERTEKEAALVLAAQRLAEYQAEADARKKAEQQFSADLEAERQERKKVAEYHEGEMRFAKMQIHEARQISEDLKSRFQTLENEKKKLESDLREEISTLRHQLMNARVELGETAGQLTSMTGERNRLSEQVEQLSRRLESSAEALFQRAIQKNRVALQTQIKTQPHAWKLKNQLGLELLFQVNELGEEQVYLGLRGQPDQGIEACQATPLFHSLERLEAFCQTHPEDYLALDIPNNGWPEKWFWEEDT